MTNKRNRLISLIVLLVFVVGLLLSLAVTSYADVGNSASHKSKSFSRSNGSSGGGYSGGWGSNRRSGGFFIGSFHGGVGPIFVLIILVIIVIILLKSPQARSFLGSLLNSRSYEAPERRDPFDEPLPLHNSYRGDPLAEIKKRDPNFSKAAFESKVNNMYMQLQEAWMNKNWKAARVFETDELFNMHKKQLQKYIDNHTTNRVDNICILKTDFFKYENDGINDIAYVRIEARINDYIVDDNTGKVIEGNPNTDIYMSYDWELIRKSGVVTKVASKPNEVTQCPNCGANVSINAAGECEYCSSTISSGQYDWVLASIEVVSQHS